MVTLPGPGGVDQAGAAEHRVGPEVHRVEELVVDPAVDDVHRLEPVGGPHHHPAAPAHQVAALDQLDAHRPGQQRVLEVGAVVDARRQHDDRRVGDAGRRRGAQRGQQPLRVARDRADPVLGERSRAAPRRSPAGWSSRRTPRTAPGRCPRAPGTRRRRRGSGRSRRRARGRRWAAGRRPRRGGSATTWRPPRAGPPRRANTCPASYTSARNASSARTRCWTPRSIVDQVSISMTRGRMSSGNARSSPPMSKVTPWSRYADLQRLDAAGQLGDGHLVEGRAQPAVRRPQLVLVVEHLVVRRSRASR